MSELMERTKPELSCRLIRGVEEAEREAKRWEALAREASEPNLFAEPWFMLPAVALGEEPEGFEVLFIEQEDKLLGVFPLHRTQVHSRVPIEKLAFYNHDFLPLSVPLVKREHEREVMAAFVDFLGSESRALGFHVDRAATSGPVFAALMDAVRASGLVFEPQRIYTRAFFDPREPVDDYVKQYVSHKKRDQAKRTAKKLGEQGTLTFDAYDGTQPVEAAQRWLDEFLDLEASGWKGKEGTALRSRPETESFFRKVMTSAAERKRLFVFAMRLDGRAIAMKCNLLDAPTSYTYKVCYDESFAKLSPGVLIELECMKRVVTLPGIRMMDSAGRAENPPFDWLWNERRSMGQIELSTGNVPSDLYVMGRPAARWLKRRSIGAFDAFRALSRR